MMKEVVSNMKKIYGILFIFALIFTLIGCTNNEVEDVEITIKNEEIFSDKINIDVVVPNKIKTIEEIEEIAYNIASQVYEKHFESIGTSTYLLTINLYDSSSSYDSKDMTYGMITFDINKSLEQPGLSLNTNSLSIE